MNKTNIILTLTIAFFSTSINAQSLSLKDSESNFKNYDNKKLSIVVPPPKDPIFKPKKKK